MKVIVSPSKTKKLNGGPTGNIFCAAVTDQIVARMQTLSTAAIGKALKLKEDAAAAVRTFFLDYDVQPVGCAALSYDGLAFKNLGWAELSEAAKAYGRERLVILSGLYGVVTPDSPVKDYRLDVADAIFKDAGTSLYELWREPVKAYFAETDWILNFASKEYARMVTHPRVVTVEFLEEKNGIWKQLSTSSKQMRGRMARYVLEAQVALPSDLPAALDEFVRDDSQSSETLITYRRRG